MGRSVAPHISIGPRVRKSPYFEATLRWGARAFTVYNHVFMPTLYSDPVSEYWSLVRDVTLWDVACQRQIRITGPDALPFVELLTPRDLSDCPVLRCLYVLLTGTDGGIVNDAVLVRLREDEFWLSPGDGDVLLWAQGLAARAGLDVAVSETDVSPLQLQGPKAPQLAQRLFGDAALELGYYRATEVELGGLRLLLSRTGWSGELGYEIYLGEPARGDWLWETVMQAGRDLGIAPAAPSAIRSIEGALLSYGSDIRRQDNPFTLGLERLVDLDKRAEFIGRDALRRIRDAGGHRRLVGVEIDGAPLPGNESFWLVIEGETGIGHVSRCAWSPRLERNIALANLPPTHTAAGTGLSVDTPAGARPARVVALPWFPPQKIMPRKNRGLYGD
jgi:glycine cleavage system aminomethyltransferase T